MSRILVCPTEHAEAVAREWSPSHVVGFAAPSPDEPLPLDRSASPTRPLPTGERVLRSGLPDTMTRSAKTRDGEVAELSLVFNDIVEPRPDLVAPSRADIAALLAFGADWDGARPLLVHCRMGISRSTAACLILAAAARPGIKEGRLAAALREAAPCATPNGLMIALADDLLGRDGRLAAAARAIGRGADYRPCGMFVLALAARA